MTYRKTLLEFMRRKTYIPLTAEELASALLPKNEPAFHQLLQELELEGIIVFTRKHKYGLPEKMGLLTGRLEGHPRGFGFVITEKAGEPDTYISADNLNGAMHNDLVMVRLVRAVGYNNKPEGEITRILQRANQQVVGTFEYRENVGLVTPDDTRLAQTVLIPRDETGQAGNKDKVVVEITRWPEKRSNPEGRVIEVLGRQGDPGVDILSIVRKHHLPESFPPAVLKEADRIPLTIRQEDLSGRRDLRGLRMVTIDGADARDLDDAVSIEVLPDGQFRLGVHIADVGHYVREGSQLDQEAFKRATSVYLVDRVIPMLPPRLSNGICSLNAGEDRLALTCLMDVNRQGTVQRYEIFPSIIRVGERMTYAAVQGILNLDAELMHRYQHLAGDFRLMEQLCRILYQRRQSRGAIDFQFPECKVKLDERGRPTEIISHDRMVSEQIIEEFMLLANETVALHLHNLHVPAIYRVHEEPGSDNLRQLREFLDTLGYGLKQSGDHGVRPAALQAVVNQAVGRPESKVVNTVVLRSMKHARYDAECLGHFGLAAEYYCHFTSPIRRYPDLAVHRIIREVLVKGKPTPRRYARLVELMQASAEQSSIRERAAEEAERETVDLKKVEYLQRFVGQVLPGTISGVTSFGLFVELANTVEGLVHVSTMTDDYYQYIEKNLTLIGQHTKKSYRIGAPVTVQVVRADVETRRVDFDLVEENGSTPARSPASVKVTPQKGKPRGRTEGTKETKGNVGNQVPKKPKGAEGTRGVRGAKAAKEARRSKP